jgi:hypothetical protein
MWTELTYALAGDSFVNGLAGDDRVVGLSCTVKLKENVFEVWTKKAVCHNPALLSRIRQICSKAVINSSYYTTNQATCESEGVVVKAPAAAAPTKAASKPKMTPATNAHGGAVDPRMAADPRGMAMVQRNKPGAK